MAAAPTHDELDRYFELEKERLSLGRQAKALGEQQATLEEKFEAYVRAEGGKQRCKIRFGYRLLLKDKRESVGWKNAFVGVAGKEAAESLVEAQPTKEVLEVEAPA